MSSINAQKEELERLGHTVKVFSSGFPKSEKALQELAKQNIFQVPSCKYCFRGLTPVSRRPGIVEKWLVSEHPEIKDYDVFYIHYESGCSIAGLRLGKKLGIPTVQVMHGREDKGEASLIPFGFRTIVAVLLNWFHSWYLPHETKVRRDGFYADTIASTKMWNLMVNHANYADLVLTPSNHFREKLLRYGVKKEIKVLPNGYKDEYFPKNPAAKQVLPDQELKMIWHSRVSSEKRIMQFLKALTKVEKKFILDVFGDGNDLVKARRFAEKHQLNVKFHGNKKFTDFQKKLADSHLDVLVSYDYDTFGMTLIEAEAYGVPVFFCDPDMQEIVPKDSFVLSANESSEEMAEALNDLLDHPERIQKMSEVMLEHRKEVLISSRIKTLETMFNGIMKK